jgi:hypothetical protein
MTRTAECKNRQRPPRQQQGAVQDRRSQVLSAHVDASDAVTIAHHTTALHTLMFILSPPLMASVPNPE